MKIAISTQLFYHTEPFKRTVKTYFHFNLNPKISKNVCMIAATKELTLMSLINVEETQEPPRIYRKSFSEINAQYLSEL